MAKSKADARPGPGKWPAADLARLLRTYAPAASDDVILGPAIGEDAAVVRIGSEPLVVACDPITFTSDSIGYGSVIVNANDVAATGARPRFFLATVLLPVGVSRGEVEAIFAGLAEACREVGALLVGGHTERTAGIDRPLVVGTMIGDLEGREPVLSGGARPGDRVVVTKGAAIEATALIARRMGDRLRPVVGDAAVERARRYLSDPGISVVRDARIARDSGASAMHDVTEGGVVTGLWEMARASGLGLEVDARAIPVSEETALLCGAVGIDPLEAIGSGALLAAGPPDDAERIAAALSEAGLRASIVGEFLEEGGACTIRRNGHTRELVPPDADPIARLFD